MKVAPIVGSAAFAFLVVASTVWRARTTAGGLFAALIIASLVMALGAAFIFDDPSSDSIASLPTGLLYRRAFRLLVTIATDVAVWALLLLVAAPEAHGLPVGRLTLAFAAMLAVTFAMASSLGKIVGEGLGGLFAGPALLVLVTLARVLPPRFRFFDASDVPGYSISLRLSVVVAISLAATLWTSLDPGRPVNRLSRFARQG